MVLIKPDLVEKIRANIVKLKNNNDYEFECKIKYCTNSEMMRKQYSNLPKAYFDRAMKYLLSLNLNHDFQNESLDIATSKYRITISDLNEIVSYINTNSWDHKSKNISIIKVKENINHIDVPGLNLVFDLKKESKVVNTEEICDLVKTELKFFRLKKRWTFKENDDWKYDLTIVRSSQHKNVNYMKFDCLDSYEIEVEFIGKAERYKQYLNSCLRLYSVIYGEENLIISDEKILVATEFYQMKQNMWKIKSNLCPVSLDNIRQKFNPDEKYLSNIMVGPKPITLGIQHLIKQDFGITSLLDDYTVTPKADGERYLLWINSVGRVYLIDSSATIKWTGITVHGSCNTLIDGELVTNQEIFSNLYAIFDIYVYNNKFVANCSLIPKNTNSDNSRVSYIQEFFKTNHKKFSEKGIILYQKEYLYDSESNLLNKCKLILNKKDSYPFKIDGLVFTPKHLGVNCYFSEDVSNMKQNTWNLLYKWKPPDDNTIDFLIRFDSGNLINEKLQGHSNKSDKTVQRYKLIHLYVADKYSREFNVLEWMRLTSNSSFDEVKKNLKSLLDADSIPKLFTPNSDIDISQTIVPINDDNKIILDNGQEIVNDTIVEFYWNDKWIPLRNREIKTQIYQTQKLRNNRSYISNTANYWDTAISIWNSIQNPVTEEMICGDSKIEYQEETEKYYLQTIPREKRASARITHYHNWIKSQSLDEMKSAESLMDIACGKGGDIYKWRESNFTKIFGIDIFRDNIENVSDGAYTRTAEHYVGKKNINLDFSQCSNIYLTLDASNKITDEYINSLEHKNDLEAAKILYKIYRPDQHDLRKKYWGYACTPFKVVSCQFAIHYFFESSEILDNFIWNVNRHLDNSGYFIGTCLDGKLVKKRLTEIAYNNWIEGRYNNRIMWAIKKLYKSNSESFGFGEKIRVYMESINNEKNEYLVNLELLKDRLQKFNIFPLNDDELKNLKISSSFRNFNQYIDKYSQIRTSKLTESDKDYSYLNTTFVFKKIAFGE